MRCHACDWRTHGRTVESRAVFSLSWIRNTNTNTYTKLHILKRRRYSYGSSGSSTPLVVKNTSNMIYTNTKYFKTPTLWQIPQLIGPDGCTALGKPPDDIVSEQVPEFWWPGVMWSEEWVVLEDREVDGDSPHSRQLLLLCRSPGSSSSFSLLIIISTHGSKSTMSMQIRNKCNSPITQRWLTQIASERKLSGEQLQGFPLRGSRRKREKYLVERKTSRAAGFPTPPKSLPLKLILTQLLPLGKWRR